MGKGTIKSGGADGRYTIEMDFGDSLRDARVATLNAQIGALTTGIAALVPLETAAIAAVTAAQATHASAVNALAAAMAADPTPAAWKAEQDAQEAALKALFKARTAATPITIRLKELRAQLAALQRDVGRLTGLALIDTREAWCVDLTEDGTGEVSTVEVKGQTDLVLIQAGCRPPVAGDGAALATDVMSPEQAYWNYAALPGWQRWKPTYRTGTITAIDYNADTATVTLDAATSQAQTLDVNAPPPEKVDVPITYMTCNSWAFDEGDAVVVMFPTMDWANPRVIGFVNGPKSCNRGEGWRINSGHYVRRSEATDYLWRANGLVSNGNVSWTGTGRYGSVRRTVSWNGMVGKHLGKFIVSNSTIVYYGTRQYYFPLMVHGAFAEKEAGGHLWIYAQCRDHTTLPSNGEWLYRIREDQDMTLGVAELVWSCVPMTRSTGSPLPDYVNTSRTNYTSVFWNSSATAAVGMDMSSGMSHPFNIIRYTRDGGYSASISYISASTGGPAWIDGAGSNESYVVAAEYVGDTEVTCIATRWGSGYEDETGAYGSGGASLIGGGISIAISDSGVHPYNPYLGLSGTSGSLNIIAIDLASGMVSYVESRTTWTSGNYSTLTSVIVAGDVIGAETTATGTDTSVHWTYSHILMSTIAEHPLGSFMFAYGHGGYIGQFRGVSFSPTYVSFNSGDFQWATGSAVKPDAIAAAGGPAWPSFSALGVV